jgi:hypothetical protein
MRVAQRYLASPDAVSELTSKVNVLAMCVALSVNEIAEGEFEVR